MTPPKHRPSRAKGRSNPSRGQRTWKVWVQLRLDNDKPAQIVPQGELRAWQRYSASPIVRATLTLTTPQRDRKAKP